MKIKGIIGLLGLTLSTISLAHDPQSASQQQARTPANDPQQQATTPPPHREFAGIGFGLGISFTRDYGNKDRVESASVVNGIVRVDEERNAVARVMLESHYFFKPNREFLGQDYLSPGKWGHGPFVALQPGTDEFIEAVGFGWMLGFRTGEATGGLTRGWNIGIGLVVDPNTKVLGDGIKKNEPLPPGETEARTKEESETGFLLITSFAF